jgi:hypothetical protein
MTLRTELAAAVLATAAAQDASAIAYAGRCSSLTLFDRNVSRQCRDTIDIMRERALGDRFERPLFQDNRKGSLLPELRNERDAVPGEHRVNAGGIDFAKRRGDLGGRCAAAGHVNGFDNFDWQPSASHASQRLLHEKRPDANRAAQRYMRSLAGAIRFVVERPEFRWLAAANRAPRFCRSARRSSSRGP